MPISNDAFAKKMLKALRKAGVDQLRYDRERYALVNASGSEFFLASAHQFYQQASFWKRGSVLKQYAQTMFHAPLMVYPKTFDEARGNLVPVVHTTAYLDVAELLMRTRAGGGDKKKGPHYLTLAGSLCYGLAYDTPQALGMFPADQLVEWGVSFDEAMKAARYNLSVRSRDSFREVVPGLFVAPWQDANAAGRIVLTELLTRLPVNGDVIASVPGRDFLLVAGSEDANALAAMLALIEKAIAAPKANTPEMYRLHGTEWAPFTMPSTHPLASKHEQLVKAFAQDDYSQQKKLIDQIFERDGVEVFVAEYLAIRLANGEIVSACSWAPCASLLPRTSEIAFVNVTATDEAEKRPIHVSWESAVEIVGHRMKRQPEFRLDRYLVEEYPTPDEIAELKKRARVR